MKIVYVVFIAYIILIKSKQKKHWLIKQEEIEQKTIENRPEKGIFMT